MVKICWSQLDDDERFDDRLFESATQKAQKLFEEKYLSQVQEGTKNPPRDYVCLKGMIICEAKFIMFNNQSRNAL